MSERLEVAATIFASLLAKADAWHQARLFEDPREMDRVADQAASAADAIVRAVEQFEARQRASAPPPARRRSAPRARPPG